MDDPAVWPPLPQVGVLGAQGDRWGGQTVEAVGVLLEVWDKTDGGLPVRKPFCDHHVRTREKDGSGSDTTCAAHLADGRAFECPYDSLVHARGVQYPCVDGKPIEERPTRRVPTEIEW